MDAAFKKKQSTQASNYSRFDSIDGEHPLKNQTDNSYIEYPARVRKGGKCRFFNFALAKEMGLIAQNHEEKLNLKLEKKILETFGLVIINEYDQLNNIKFKKSTIKKNKYMATRYLQLQHADKRGLYSGDGRSIWNGTTTHKGKTWDISSCGTGATRLSPATAKYNKYFQTGDPTISYGCGYAEVHEGLAALFMGEVFNKNHLKTERVLAIIEYDNNFAINVRAYDNLLRPSHVFNHLKQNDVTSLRKMIDYYISRQSANKSWKTTEKNKYDYFLKKISDNFAKTTANFEDHYIFCWLDWDGDNILMDGGIIDYGSVRQFGLFHHEYRFDDDDRYSTSILEQKNKAKYIIQTFIQAVDFIKKGKKKTLDVFKNHALLDDFDKTFLAQKTDNFVSRLALNPKWADFLIKKETVLLSDLNKSFSYFEKSKSCSGVKATNDGVSCDAIYSMRDLLREYPQLLLADFKKIKPEDFVAIMLSSYALEEDKVVTSYRKKMIGYFQSTYMDMIGKISKKFKISIEEVLLELTMRSSVVNKYDRITGDAITFIVEKIVKNKKLKPAKLNEILNHFVEYQNLDPKCLEKEPLLKEYPDKLLEQMIEIVGEYRETI